MTTSPGPVADGRTTGDLQLWWAVPGPALAVAAQVCTSDERARAARLPDARQGRDWLITRGVLRHLLGVYTAVPPALVELRADAKGKLGLPGRDQPRFSVAHTDGLAAVAIGPFEVGVDVQRCGSDLDLDAVTRYSFSASETSTLRALPEHDRRAVFYRAWCRKEAYLKALGTGWRLPLGEVPDTVTGSALDCLRLDVAGLRGHWQILDVPTRPGFAGAVAARGSGWTAAPPRLFTLGLLSVGAAPLTWPADTTRTASTIRWTGPGPTADPSRS